MAGGGTGGGVEEQENTDGKVVQRGRGKSENGSSKKVRSGRKKWKLSNNAKFSLL